MRVRLMISVTVAVAAGIVAFARPAGAQTWAWQIVVHQKDHAPTDTTSRVVLSNTDLSLAYSVLVNHAEVPITSCHAQIGDVASAREVPSPANPYLYVAFKPGRAADCGTGRQSIAIVPIVTNAEASRAIGAINRACCNVAAARPAPAPTPSATPKRAVALATPTPSARPQRSQPPAPLLDDWVENAGLFYFVRIRNRSGEMVAIAPARIENCRNVAAGCGPVSRPLILAPGATAALAGVMSQNAANPPAFTYSYSARSGKETASGSGTWRKRPVVPAATMSDEEIRSVEASTIAALARPGVLGVQKNVKAILIERGSSRLAIGQTGTAIVRVHVSAEGLPVDASLVSATNKALAPAAIETAVSSKYMPALQDGRRVDSDYIAQFRFNGEDPAQSTIPVWKRSASASPLPNAAAPAPAAIPSPSARPTVAPPVVPPPPTPPPATPAPPTPPPAVTPQPAAT